MEIQVTTDAGRQVIATKRRVADKAAARGRLAQHKQDLPSAGLPQLQVIVADLVVIIEDLIEV